MYTPCEEQLSELTQVNLAAVVKVQHAKLHCLEHLQHTNIVYIYNMNSRRKDYTTARSFYTLTKRICILMTTLIVESMHKHVHE
jgi:hypothetical protein